MANSKIGIEIISSSGPGILHTTTGVIARHAPRKDGGLLRRRIELEDQVSIPRVERRVVGARRLIRVRRENLKRISGGH